MVGGGLGALLYAPPNNPYRKWYQTIPLYTHSLALNFVENNFSLMVPRLKKCLKV